MSVREGFRPIDAGVHTDFREAMSYADYLELDTLLAAQHPRSEPPHHDELLFIVQHQTTELWLKLVLHELRAVRDYLDANLVHQALKCLARVKHIQRTLTEQWSVLATLTPSEYAEFRGTLGTASGFQSAQYRAVEFILGNKNEHMLKVFASDEAASAMLSELLDQPSVYDAFLRFLPAAGWTSPTRCCSVTCGDRGLCSRRWFRSSNRSTAPSIAPSTSTRHASAWLTWRTTSSSGDSVTCELCSVLSASRRAPAAPLACAFCRGRWT